MKKFLILIFSIFLFNFAFAQNWLHLSWSVEETKPKWFFGKLMPTNFSIINLSFDWNINDEETILTPANSKIFISIFPKFLNYDFDPEQKSHKIKIIMPLDTNGFKVKAKIPTNFGFFEKTWNFYFAKREAILVQNSEPPIVKKENSGDFLVYPFYFSSKDVKIFWEKNGERINSKSFSGDLSNTKLIILNPQNPLEDLKIEY